MPRRKTPLYQNAHYHIYNKGIESLEIFREHIDYVNFENIIAYYLTTLQEVPEGAMSRTGLKYTGLFQDKVRLFAYYIDRRQFHLILHQTDKDSLSKFMTRIGTAYAMYFNNKYDHSGTIFHGRYKAKHIDTQDYILESTKYIHKLKPNDTTAPKNYPYSSYKRYLDYHTHSGPQPKLIYQVIEPKPILDHLYNTRPGISYHDYIENTPHPDWFTNLTDWIK